MERVGGESGKDVEDEGLTRGDFMRQLVEQLRVNERAAQAVGAGAPREDEAKECAAQAQAAFRALGYDFPLLTQAQARALEQVLSERLRAGAALPEWFWLSPKVLEGAQYLLFERRAQESGAAAAPRTLAMLYATLLVKSLERLVSPQTAPGERRRLLSGPSPGLVSGLGSGGSSEERAEPGSALRTSLLDFVGLISYQSVALVSLEDWEAGHLTATLFRAVRALLELGQSSAPFLLDAADASEVEMVAELRGLWPRLLFMLRDRIADKPEAIPHVLPALADSAALCGARHAALQESVLGPHTSASGADNVVLVAVLGSLANSPALAAAPAQHRALLWELVHAQIVPGAGTAVQALVATTAPAASAPALEPEERSQQSAVAPRAEDVLASLLAVLELYGRGDPRKSSFAAPRVATEALAAKGVLRALAHAWATGADQGAAQACPRLLPPLAPLRAAAAAQEAAEAAGDTQAAALARGPLLAQDSAVQRFLFVCCLRSPDALAFALRVPGFAERCTRLVAPLDALLWAMAATTLGPSAAPAPAATAAAAAAATPTPTTTAKGAKDAKAVTSALAMAAGASTDAFRAAAELRLRQLRDGPLDAAQLKLVVDLLERLDCPEWTRALNQPSARHLQHHLVDAIKAAMQHSVALGQAAAKAAAATDTDGAAQPDRANAARSREGAQAVQDRTARVRTLAKRFLCSIDDIVSKAD